MEGSAAVPPADAAAATIAPAAAPLLAPAAAASLPIAPPRAAALTADAEVSEIAVAPSIAAALDLSTLSVKERMVAVDALAATWLATPEGFAASATALRLKFKMGWNHAKRLYAKAHGIDLLDSPKKAKSDGSGQPPRTSARGRASGADKTAGGKGKPKTYEFMLLWALDQSSKRKPVSMPWIAKTIGARFDYVDIETLTYGRAIRKALSQLTKAGRIERVRSSFRTTALEVARKKALTNAKLAKEREKKRQRQREADAKEMQRAKRVRYDESTLLRRAEGKKHRDAHPLPPGRVPSGVAGRAFGDIVTAHASLCMFAEALDDPSLAVGLLALLGALCGGARSGAERDGDGDGDAAASASAPDADALLAHLHIALLRHLLDAAAARAKAEAAARRASRRDSRRVDRKRDDAEIKRPGVAQWDLDLDLNPATWPELLRLAVAERAAKVEREARFVAISHALAKHPCERAAKLPPALAAAAAALAAAPYRSLGVAHRVALLVFLCDEVCASPAFAERMTARVKSVLDVEQQSRSALAQERRESKEAEQAAVQARREAAAAAATLGGGGGGPREGRVHTIASVRKLLAKHEAEKVQIEALVERAALPRRRRAARKEELRLRAIEKALLESQVRAVPSAAHIGVEHTR